MAIDIDSKAAKQTRAIGSKLEMGEGEELVLAVPVKQGSVAAGTLGLLGIGVIAAVGVEAYQRGKVEGGTIAKAVQKQVGSGTDHLLCLTTRRLIIVRKIAFGLTGSAHCYIPNRDIVAIHTDRKRLKGLALIQYRDNSTMPFKVPRNADLDLLRQAADQIYGPPASASRTV